jgi:hypothetical protein
VDDDIPQRLAGVEAEVRLLQVALAIGITTQRVTIVDEDGNERIVLGVNFDTASVLVRRPSPKGATTGVELYANGPLDHDGMTSLCVLDNGNIASWWPRQ